MEGGWALKFIFCLMGTAHELLHLHKLNLVSKRLWTYLQVLFELLLFCLTNILNTVMLLNL
jgi:hypothetical protein